MPAHSENPSITLHHDVYPGIDINTRLKDAAKGKVVYITGASRGIGESTVYAYAKAGASGIFITARSISDLKTVAETAKKTSSSVVVEPYAVDVTDDKQVGESVKKCIEKFGRIDVVVANAGYLEKWTKIGDSDPDGWWKSVSVSVRGSFNVIHHTIKYLVETKGYAILLSSAGAQARYLGASGYQSAKHQLNRFAEFIQVEYGSEGVKVFAIHPGGVLTKLAANEPSIVPLLKDKVELASHTMVRLTSGSEDYLSGRYVSCNWDLDELVKRRKEIEEGDLLKNRLDIGSLADAL
ncbi:short-chain dehydrogenase/reductase SDR [Neolentinus lepideus HHB14362 ss-1]|uniref:Short-chain dehydrogenase/reductase SDR n=1 Tax=Neolentinus lepideus HHB14362 ss-1 TaxID=1314782 RepID=A0A165RTY0_9AGAM|nr:short-chain dehydrogenase/reductase SDR [Neolentinus lepideus HHB14362 ss-1]